MDKENGIEKLIFVNIKSQYIGRPHFPADGCTFLRTVGAQRAIVRPYEHEKKQFLKWLQIERYNEIERVCVP